VQCTGKVTRVVVEEDTSCFGVVGGFDDEHIGCHAIVQLT
jgi:hypothetical protein